jgi:hypothetical protein
VEHESQISSETDEDNETPAVEKNGFNLALFITLFALIAWFGFQTLALVTERSNLGALKSNQETALQESHKVRNRFENLMSKTSELANKGHAGAKMVIDQLQQRGFSVQPETKIESKPESKAAK